MISAATNRDGIPCIRKEEGREREKWREGMEGGRKGGEKMGGIRRD